MKALIYTKTGDLDVLQIKEIDKPTPKDNQVLISVKACALSITDYERFKTLSSKVSFSTQIISALMGFAGSPIGAEIAGVVVEVGENITHVKVGDSVYGKTAGAFPKGGFAEYALMDKDHVCVKPQNMTFEQASAISISFETALGALRKGNVRAGQQVMIYGSSGGVGLYAVQLAKSMGANVTGVCSTRNLELAKQMGCDYVIDYKKEDFTKVQTKFDAIIGVNGCNSMKDYKRLLKPNGIFVGVGGNVKQVSKAFLLSFISRNFSYFAGPIMPQKDYLSYAKELAETGKLLPYIDKIYSVKDTKEAIRYIVSSHAQGKVVVSMDFK
ncbi:NAD(P)-dependent alcohol dehydrogenase [Bifidobacterium vespertilionis]|uniref:NAD(P)-dependent alcohol dehydrogenase n=1 Tax=Bifidobacterium vespertilionis TaxID=2562524 RepID=A0A5J5DXQ5_9BIFI|nr:NAD(P)-dependent alcohol dehydrogenase [Bifidobacterium vespertilionis]KAA8821616.1 NAD(P)-dependent alcohol dehydrogenase [Bifidobacterium vespertilionis]KAA8824696.1 NAD(P)-dependent alcohol dehydrogenase [Bifidobacterium vespertilionis]